MFPSVVLRDEMQVLVPSSPKRFATGILGESISYCSLKVTEHRSTDASEKTGPEDLPMKLDVPIYLIHHFLLSFLEAHPLPASGQTRLEVDAPRVKTGRFPGLGSDNLRSRGGRRVFSNQHLSQYCTAFLLYRLTCLYVLFMFPLLLEVVVPFGSQSFEFHLHHRQFLLSCLRWGALFHAA